MVVFFEEPKTTTKLGSHHVSKLLNYSHIALEVTDAESVLKQVVNLGINVTEEVEFKGAKFFFIRDPDNNVIEFHQPASG